MTRIIHPKRRLLHLVLLVVLVLTLLPQVLLAQDSPDSGKGTVVVSALNVRKGPATSYDKAGLVHSGDELQVKGKFGACAWLYIETPSGIIGWVAGNARFVKLETACSDVPEIDPKTAEIVVPTPVATAAATIASSPAATLPASEATTAPTSTPLPEPASAPVEPTVIPSSPVEFYGTLVPADKGCVAWGAYIGPDVHITATHRDPREIVENTLLNNTVTVVCYTPGTWNFTFSPISNRWRDHSFEYQIYAGDTLDWPWIRQF